MTATTDPRTKGLVDKSKVEKNLSSRDKKNSLNKWLFFACIVFALIVLAALLIQTLVKGVGHLQVSHLQHHHKLGLKAH